MIRQAIKQITRRYGFDIVPYPLPDWVPLRACLLDIFSRLRINCVLDVGAHTGEYASFLRQCGYTGHIFSFEPVMDNFEKLQRVASKDPKWDVYHHGLGEEDAVVPINVAELTVFSSFLEPNQFSSARFGSQSRIARTELVKIKRLDSVLPDLMSRLPETRFFLKSDTQGYDLNVIRGLGSQLSQILALQTELSVLRIYSGVPDYLSVLKTLSQLGFEPAGLFPVTRDRDGIRAIEFDCVLGRSETDEADAACPSIAQSGQQPR